MGTRERRERSDKADHELSLLFNQALIKNNLNPENFSLAAVGGYGRGELSPGSDLDLTIIHKEKKQNLESFVSDMLYPLWSKGIAVDYSVRTIKELESASNDLRVILGALDLRYIAGSKHLVEDALNLVLQKWRKNKKMYLSKLKTSISERVERSGELAFLLEPDLKEARGGLRDCNILRAISKLDKLKVPLEKISEAELFILNVRDVLHSSAPKMRDQLLLSEQDKVAKIMGLKDADALMLNVSKSARTIDYISDSIWHVIEHSKSRFNRTKPIKVAEGIESFNNELVLEKDFIFSGKPGIGLRIAAIASQQGLPIAPESVARIAEHSEPLPIPWNRQAREDLITLIGSGNPLIQIFESLDQENLIESWIPEWTHVRFLPQRNVLHRHTVDRHMLETAVVASSLTRTVRRPDLLLFAALFHDIGKGFPDKDHSEFGSELIANLAERIGFPAGDIEILVFLVKEHLTLSTAATRRDLDDPQTISDVVAKVKNQENLHLLHALSVADGLATGKSAWSDWKAQLVNDLVSKCELAMSGEDHIAPPNLELPVGFSGELEVSITKSDSSYVIETIAKDQVGLLSAIAGVLTLNRLDLRNAKTKTISEYAVGKWIVIPDVNAEIPSPEKLKNQISLALVGELDLQGKIDQRIEYYRRQPGIRTPAPVVIALNDIATNATVVEVRMHDRPGILYSVSKSISRFGFDIKAVVISTLGAEAFDTIYLTTSSGEALTGERAKLLANQIESALITYR